MTAASYYRTRLSGHRLRRCYELAPPRVQQYLDAEVTHVLGRIEAATSVLELGCGYGRVLERLVRPDRRAIGIDTSLESLQLARRGLAGKTGSDVAAMDARALGFAAGAFDAVVCVQNGICAFRADPRSIFEEALRVARPGRTVLFSSYADAFWPHRLQWFEIQAAERLVGEIDYAATRPGEIVFKDGLRLGTFGVREFMRLCDECGVRPTVAEVDESSLFCEIALR